jgi:hypothetical protein
MGGQHLNQPIVGMAVTQDAGGYWLVASDGGIFAFGDAVFAGSMGGQHLVKPVVGMAADPATDGYWEVAADGGIFSFTAPFAGSAAGTPAGDPAIGMTGVATGTGYAVVSGAGAVAPFGDAPDYGDETTADPGYQGTIVAASADAPAHGS